MNCDIKRLDLKGDRILVKQLNDVNKVGTFYIPDSVIDRKKKRRADAWKGEVVILGDKIDFEYIRHELKIGEKVWCSPVSLDCPKIVTEDGTTYIIITQEDMLAVEVN